MKKKKLKTLEINKKLISGFGSEKLIGGATAHYWSCIKCRLVDAPGDPVSTWCNTNTDQVECTLHFSDLCTSRTN